jgi:hypothetical protein
MPRQRPNEFHIADPRANSRLPPHRFPVIYGSTTRSPGVKFSNDFSRACVGAYVQGGQSPFAWPQGSAPSDGRLEGGYRDAVRAFFQDMRMRGLGDPLLVVSDGAPGVIRAIEECFPRSARQRCLAHRMRNLAVKVPTDLWPRVQDAGGGLLSGAVTGDRARAHQRHPFWLHSHAAIRGLLLRGRFRSLHCASAVAGDPPPHHAHDQFA